MLGKIKGKRGRGLQRVRWHHLPNGCLSLSKLWDIMKDREDWHAAYLPNGYRGWMASLTQWTSESEQTLGHNEGQGSLACGNSWCSRVSERLSD